MSFMVPLLLRDLLDDSASSRPSRLLDQHFGCGVCADDLLAPMTLPAQSLLGRPNYYRPWRSAMAQKDAGSTVAVDKDKFQVNLDVQQFAPEEISVKVSDDDNSIIVEGKHEEKKDEHGYISRHFIRRYILPPGHDSKEIVSTLSSDGVLTITAPKLKEDGKPAERVIQITQTGPVRKVKASPEKTEPPSGEAGEATENKTE